MFNKKVSVIYFEGKPIACLDVMEFTSKEEYVDFKNECEKNQNELKLKLEKEKNDFVSDNQTFKNETKGKVKDLASVIDTLLK